jgi:hypothetical protein
LRATDAQSNCAACSRNSCADSRLALIGIHGIGEGLRLPIVDHAADTRTAQHLPHRPDVGGNYRRTAGERLEDDVRPPLA